MPRYFFLLYNVERKIQNEILPFYIFSSIFLLYCSKMKNSRAAQCIDKEIFISKNGNIDIDIEIDKRMF